MDWSAMIPELLKHITDKLPHRFDYMNFRLVCKRWLSVVPPNNFPPILILPSHPDSDELHSIDPVDDGVHPLALPEAARNKIICGASCGWLALLDKPTKAMSLVNPIAGARFQLPPVPHHLIFYDFHHREEGSRHDDCPCDDSATGGLGVHWIEKYLYISDIFLSSSPNSAAECMVVAKQRDYNQLVFCRSGHAAWTTVRTPYEICEVGAFWNGRFYAVDCNKDVLAIKLGSRDEDTIVTQPVTLPLDSKLYKLLECKGELLLFYVNLEEDEWDPITYRCDYSKGICTWSKLSSFADKTLFLSEFGYTGFLGYDLHGCKKNCIYHSQSGYIRCSEDHLIQVMWTKQFPTSYRPIGRRSSQDHLIAPWCLQELFSGLSLASTSKVLS